MEFYSQVSGTHDDENMFGDSILDDELGDMEIKIYTQVPVQKISYKRNNTSPVSDVAKSNKSDVVYETDQQSNPKSIVLENEVKCTYTMYPWICAVKLRCSL